MVEFRFSFISCGIMKSRLTSFFRMKNLLLHDESYYLSRSFSVNGRQSKMVRSWFLSELNLFRHHMERIALLSLEYHISANFKDVYSSLKYGNEFDIYLIQL